MGVLHDFGHSLDLEHISNANSIMNPFYNPNHDQLNFADDPAVTTLQGMPRTPAAIEGLEARQFLSIQAIGPESRVNTFTDDAQALPAIGIDADGDFVITWSSYGGQDGSGWGIYAQRYNAAGVTQGGELRVNSFTTNDQFGPAIGMDADGDFVITWSSYNGQDGSGHGVYAQRFNAGGVAQGGEFRVNSFTTDHQLEAAIGMDADGDFVIAWRSSTQDGSGGGIYAQRFNADGMPQGDEFRVNTFTTSSQGLPGIAMDVDGSFVAAWQSSGQDGSGDGVYAQRFNAAGVIQGGEFRVNTFTIDHQRSPRVGMDVDGDFVVAWHSFNQDGSNSGIYAQRYSAAGVAQGGESRVNTFTTSWQLHPTVWMDRDGDFVIAWGSLTQDGSEYGTYVQRYNPAGVAQGGEFRVNTFTIDRQNHPAIGMDADGDFVVAWQSYAQDGSKYGVYAQRYAVVPNVAASSFAFNTAPHRVELVFDENVSASLGTDDLVVQNLTTMQTIPASDFSVAYDPVTNTGTFSYIGTAGGISGVLSDGNYRATLLAAGVTTSNGNPLPADHVLTFQFLLGDANHDARVNLDDFNILAANFGQSPRDFTQGDFDYSGNVNLNDFNILASRFGVVVAPGEGTMARGPAGDEELPEDELLG